jgi:hypothetical protein
VDDCGRPPGGWSTGLKFRGGWDPRRSPYELASDFLWDSIRLRLDVFELRREETLNNGRGHVNGGSSGHS